MTPAGHATLTVGVAFAIENERGTSAAGLKLLSPACDAVIVQEPAPVRCTVEPLALQLPLAPNVTVRLEDAMALTEKSGLPNVLPDSAAKVIVCLALAMENDCGTSAAGLKLLSPACDAVIVQEPAPV